MTNPNPSLEAMTTQEQWEFHRKRYHGAAKQYELDEDVEKFIDAMKSNLAVDPNLPAAWFMLNSVAIAFAAETWEEADVGQPGSDHIPSLMLLGIPLWS